MKLLQEIYGEISEIPEEMHDLYMRIFSSAPDNVDWDVIKEIDPTMKWD